VITDALRTRILTIAAVTALASTRVYLLHFPPGVTFPAVRIQQIGELEEVHLRGSGTLRRARVQIDAVATDDVSASLYCDAADLSDAVHGSVTGGAATGLVGFQGTIGGVDIASIIALDRRETFDPTARRMVVVSRDYWVTFHG
jgi:hypothetical protein